VIVSLDNKGRQSFLKRRIVRKRLFYNRHSGSAEVIILPYSENEIDAMSDKRLHKIIRRISGELDGKMVLNYENDRLNREIERFDIYRVKGNNVFIEMLDKVVVMVAKRTGTDLMDGLLGVYAYELCEQCERIIGKLSGLCMGISLYTKNMPEAEKLCQRVYDATGMPVMVCDSYTEWIRGKRLAVLVGDFMEMSFPVRTELIDVLGSSASTNAINSLRFEFDEDFYDISKLTNRKPDNKLVEFILETGAELKIGEDINLKGYSVIK